MEMEEYLYQKVLSKVHYDKEKQEYIIKLTDYTYLNLSNEQFRKLKQICHRKKIKLEYTNEQIPIIEDLEAFEQYNNIKQKLSTDTTNQELEQKRIEIRNKIASQNFNAIRILLNRMITGLPQMNDKEDIYQIGYTTLLEFIDSYDIIKKDIFTISIKKYLICHISKKIIIYQKNIGKNTNTSMQLVTASLDNQDISLEELSNKLNISKKHIKELINLESILTPISIEEETDLLTKKNNEEEKSLLFDDTFEISILKRLSNEFLLKVIKTLPEQQMEVLMLYYGFINDHCYNINEIADMYGLTRARINEIKIEGLKKLKLSIRSKYFFDSYEPNYLYEKETSSIKKELKILEDKLIGLIDKEELIEYTKQLSELKREIIFMKYGIKDGTYYNLKTISKKLGLSEANVYKLKESALNLIKYQIIRKYYNIKEVNDISYEQYIDYLMKIYLSKPIPKTKQKKL